MIPGRGRHTYSVILIWFCLFAVPVLRAQTPQSLRQKSLNIYADTVSLDTFAIVPGSIVIRKEGMLLSSPSDFQIDYHRALLIPSQSLKGSSIDIQYRVFGFRLLQSYRHKPLNMIEPELKINSVLYNYNVYNNSGGSDIFRNSGLNVDGNISRGIGVGNNQDVVLNSNLNLRLSGKLGKEIDVLAAISDENNPIQPEGNTQQLQDFDRVFITLSKDSSALTVGDFLMSRPQGSYFMNYYKKSRGLQLSHMGALGKTAKHYAQAEAAISRGRFARNEIQGQEANQGPYRLTGANNETYIILIAGTEAVYLDGERLTRGQQNDYVIDYNTGELTFMPKRLITRYSRIVIEFQYSDRNYARSVVHLGERFNFGKFKLRVNYFTEQDNRSQPTDTTNRDIIQEALENAGDNPAFIQNIRSFSSFQSDRVMYRRIDSLGYNIFVHTADPASDTVFYSVSFSYVGEGNGNYRNIASASNGKVYAWIEPVGGVPQGNYEPVSLLVAPKRLQMLTAGVDYDLGATTHINAEVAGTDNNINTFSELDKANDRGLAGAVTLTDKQQFGSSKQWILSNSLNYEYADANFRYVERYRNVEFERSWNRQLANPSAQRPSLEEHIINLKTQLANGNKHTLGYDFGYYIKGPAFKGSRHVLSATATVKHLIISAAGELQNTRDRSTVSISNNYSKGFLGFAQTWGEAIGGLQFTAERSLFKTDTSANFGSQSYSYSQGRLYLQRQTQKRFKYNLDGFYRIDYLPQASELKHSASASNATLTLQQQGLRPTNSLLFTIAFRDYKATSVSGQLPERTVLSRLEYNVSLFSGVISGTTYYQLGTGREQKLQYSYTEVQPGNGVYAWNDYNQNGVQELNEFEIAVFRDQARFIKVYLPTNEFIRSNTNEFNQTIRLQAPSKWQQEKGFRKFISRINMITAVKSDRKITDNSVGVLLNPLKLNVADTSLISVNSLIKHTTFFNRTNPYFGIEHNIQSNRGKSFLTNGFDTRENNKQNATVRIGFDKQWSLNIIGETGIKALQSQFFSTRNYKYRFQSLNPELFFQTRKGMRTGVFYKYSQGINYPEFGGETTYNHETGIEFRYFVVSRGSIDLKFTRTQINYSGSSFSPVAYEMLNGLQKGRNLSWNVSIGTRFSKNIQFNAIYDGRKPETTKTIHTGRVEARYVF